MGRTNSELLLDLHARYREWRDTVIDESPSGVARREALTDVLSDLAREIERLMAKSWATGEQR